jgi:hypothetical protein
VTLYTLAGIASSAVVAVELISADGLSIQRIPVRDNVYADRPLPHGVVAIAPKNTDERRLALNMRIRKELPPDPPHALLGETPSC